MERTFVMIKPDGIQRGLAGAIISRLEAKGLKMVAARFLHIDRALAEKHYGIHRDRPFFGELVSYITSGPVLATVWEGQGAIGVVRAVVGVTNPQEAAPGTIRGDYGLDISRNLIHASDGPETAVGEISLFFSRDDVVSYSRSLEGWVHPVDPSGS